MNDLFEKLGLNHSISSTLEKMGFKTPTAIQEKVIPLAIMNKDIIGKSETGTGKTLAYLLPIFQKIDANKREMQALILAPTHELVMQVYKTINLFSDNLDVKITSAAIIGDVNIKRQIEKLKEKPHIIVGTPGRTFDLIKKRKISAHTIKTIVVDEADVLLDSSHIDGVKAVIKTTLKERQLLLFSATISNETITEAKKLMKTPEFITIENKTEVNSNITHYYFTCDKRDKIELLRKLVHAINPNKAIVFINKSDDIEITTSKLKYHKLKAEGIHGSNIKEDRKKVLEAFRNGKINILVASDIAARGLDIKGVTHIFNLDLPIDPINYLHRSGRCGRASTEGTAITIASPNEVNFIRKYEKAFNINIAHKDIYNGKIVDLT
ncbi:DEAD/DEAH box helicase [Clostridium guangxiense]|uniref:DEAD/DEAH box helicase n=1 Tax=Clostridium guangxiense TaxID=1662055 RepID=UPI001E4B721E|nr:DEAD/DEAH box helicase [Clostridium guangxiense]MCD2346632.1 DEAD/DEAH box helicase [Clostridium guangxiense]